MEKTSLDYSKSFEATFGINFGSIKYLDILSKEHIIDENERKKINKIIIKSIFMIDNYSLISNRGFKSYVISKILKDLYILIDYSNFSDDRIKSLLKNFITAYKRSKNEFDISRNNT